MQSRRVRCPHCGGWFHAAETRLDSEHGRRDARNPDVPDDLAYSSGEAWGRITLAFEWSAPQAAIEGLDDFALFTLATEIADEIARRIARAAQER